MRCPRLNELPSPPPGRTGWPWTEESRILPDDLMEGRSWPRISIVTPSFNQGEFIEETIRSVLLQGYPDLEYFVMDGGSTDRTVEIIRKYEPWITGWVSEKDAGQASAINKGWRRSTGEICGYLNSDDILLKGALCESYRQFLQHPDVDLVYGDSVFTDSSGQVLRPYRARPYDQRSLFTWSLNIGQPAVFFRRNVFDSTGYLNERLRYTMDFDYWLRISIHHRFFHIPVPLATMRFQPGAKTVRDFSVFYLDEIRSLDTIFSRPDIGPEIRKYERLAYASSYLRAGYRDFQLGNVKVARKLLLAAVTRYPRFILNPLHTVILAGTCLPARSVRMLYRIKAHLTRRKNVIDLLFESVQ